jgi:hypothetical protein
MSLSYTKEALRLYTAMNPAALVDSSSANRVQLISSELGAVPTIVEVTPAYLSCTAGHLPHLGRPERHAAFNLHAGMEISHQAMLFDSIPR